MRPIKGSACPLCLEGGGGGGGRVQEIVGMPTKLIFFLMKASLNFHDIVSQIDSFESYIVPWPQLSSV